MADDAAKKKTERLHMLISPDELEEVDEWRFENRIGTRAEAVRRLVQMGLRTDRLAETHGAQSLELSKWIVELLSEHGAKAEQSISTAKVSDISHLLVAVMLLLTRAEMFSQSPQLEPLLEKDAQLRRLVEEAEKGQDE